MPVYKFPGSSITIRADNNAELNFWTTYSEVLARYEDIIFWIDSYISMNHEIIFDDVLAEYQALKEIINTRSKYLTKSTKLVKKFISRTSHKDAIELLEQLRLLLKSLSVSESTFVHTNKDLSRLSIPPAPNNALVTRLRAVDKAAHVLYNIPTLNSDTANASNADSGSDSAMRPYEPVPPPPPPPSMMQEITCEDGDRCIVIQSDFLTINRGRFGDVSSGTVVSISPPDSTLREVAIKAPKVYKEEPNVLLDQTPSTEETATQRNQKAIERFEREIEMARKLKHRNILEVLGVFHQGFHGTGIVVPHSIHPKCWGDLTRFIISHQRTFPLPLFRMLREAAMGLAYMHGKYEETGKQQFIHGDVKGTNVLVALDGTIKVCDLGLSRGEEVWTSDGMKGFGHCRWMAPEMLVSPEERKKVHRTPAVDVYGFGIMMFEVFHVPGILRPYPRLVDSEVPEHVRKGNRPIPQVEETSDGVDLLAFWALAAKCWKDLKDGPRPTMQEVVDMLPSPDPWEDAFQQRMNQRRSNSPTAVSP